MKRVLCIAVIGLVLTTNQSVMAQLFGPTWNKVDVEFPVKQEFDLSQYKKIAVGDIYSPTVTTNTHGLDINEEITVRFQKIGNIEVLDRQYLKNIMEEHKLSSSGLVDESTAVSLGKFIGSGIMLIGRIQQDSYASSEKSRTSIVVMNGCSTVNWREATYYLTVNFKIIDIQTAKVLFTKNIPVEKSAKSEEYYCQRPGDFDREAFYAECVKIFGEYFENVFKNHKETMTREFETDSKFNDELKKAIISFNVGDTEKAIEKLLMLATNPDFKDKTRARALYNLARVQMATYNYDGALKNLQLAYQLQPNEKLYLEYMTMLKNAMKP